MLNIELIETLYRGLSPEKQEHLLTLLFNGKHSIDYFREKMNDVGMTKLETLADFFHVPMEIFRKDSKALRYMCDNISSDNNIVGNIIVGADQQLLQERKALASENESLRKTIEAKDKLIEELKAEIKNLK